MLFLLSFLAGLALILAQVPEARSDYELWVAVAAALTTVASALLLRIPRGWPDLAKQAVVAAVSAGFSAVGLYYAGQLDTGNWGRTWMIIFLGATGIYVVLWKPLSEAVKASTP